MWHGQTWSDRHGQFCTKLGQAAVEFPFLAVGDYSHHSKPVLVTLGHNDRLPWHWLTLISQSCPPSSIYWCGTRKSHHETRVNDSCDHGPSLKSAFRMQNYGCCREHGKSHVWCTKWNMEKECAKQSALAWIYVHPISCKHMHTCRFEKQAATPIQMIMLLLLLLMMMMI